MKGKNAMNDAQVLVKKGWRSATVLVAEDDPVCLEMMSHALENCGYRVLRADRASLAIELFLSEGKTIDVLLTDYFMPDLNGPQLARRLTAIRPNLKVLFMTGYENHLLHILSSVEDWTDEILLKPVAPEMLDDVVQATLIGRPRSAIRSTR